MRNLKFQLRAVGDETKFQREKIWADDFNKYCKYSILEEETYEIYDSGCCSEDC